MPPIAYYLVSSQDLEVTSKEWQCGSQDVRTSDISKWTCFCVWLVGCFLFCFVFPCVFASIENAVYRGLLLFLFKFPFFSLSATQLRPAQLVVREIFLIVRPECATTLRSGILRLGCILSPLEAYPLSTWPVSHHFSSCRIYLISRASPPPTLFNHLVTFDFFFSEHWRNLFKATTSRMRQERFDIGGGTTCWMRGYFGGE